MGASLIFYTSSALTVQQFVLPVGTGETPLTLSSFSSYTEGGETYYYFTGGWNPLTASSVTAYDMTGKDYTPAITDGLSTAYIKYNSGNDNAVWDTWYSGAHVVRSSGGTAQNDPRIAAAEVLVEGVPFIALGGFDIYGVLSPSLMVSKNMLGSKAFTQQGGSDTPPGAGADANAGWGSYSYGSDEATGSAMPTSGAIPVDAGGHGHHLYRLTAAALQQLGDHLWGRGSVSDKIAAVSDLWQRWQNYRFTPIAGIISCMRLPDALTPVSTSSDVGVRLAGTHVPIDGTITGCKWIDSKPISTTVLDADIDYQYGSWLDFDGVQITLLLPFIGRVDVSPSACVGGHIKVDYQCDPLNGNTAAMIWTTDRWGKSCLYQQATGNCAVQVPLTGQSDGMIPMIGTQLSGAVSGAIAAATGNAAGVISSAVNIAGAAAMERSRMQTAGNYSGSVAYVGSTQAAVQIVYPHPTHSPNYNRVHGRPSDYGEAVSDYSGYTILHNVDVDISGATQQECSEIKRLLESGVIL